MALPPIRNTDAEKNLEENVVLAKELIDRMNLKIEATVKSSMNPLVKFFKIAMADFGVSMLESKIAKVARGDIDAINDYRKEIIHFVDKLREQQGPIKVKLDDDMVATVDPKTNKVVRMEKVGEVVIEDAKMMPEITGLNDIITNTGAFVAANDTLKSIDEKMQPEKESTTNNRKVIAQQEKQMGFFARVVSDILKKMTLANIARNKKDNEAFLKEQKKLAEEVAKSNKKGKGKKGKSPIDEDKNESSQIKEIDYTAGIQKRARDIGFLNDLIFNPTQFVAFFGRMFYAKTVGLMIDTTLSIFNKTLNVFLTPIIRGVMGAKNKVIASIQKTVIGSLDTMLNFFFKTSSKDLSQKMAGGGPLARSVLGIARTAMMGFVGLVGGAMLGGIGMLLFDAVQGYFSEPDGSISGAIKGALTGQGPIWNSVKGAALGATIGAVAGGPLGMIAGAIIGGVIGYLLNVIDFGAVKDYLVEKYDGAKEYLSSLWDSVKTQTNNLIGSVSNFASNVVNFFSGIKEWFVDKLDSAQLMTKNVYDNITNSVETIKNTLTTFFAPVIEIKQKVIDTLANLSFTEIYDSFIKSLNSLYESITGWFKSLISKINIFSGNETKNIDDEIDQYHGRKTERRLRSLTSEVPDVPTPFGPNDFASMKALDANAAKYIVGEARSDGKGVNVVRPDGKAMEVTPTLFTDTSALSRAIAEGKGSTDLTNRLVANKNINDKTISLREYAKQKTVEDAQAKAAIIAPVKNIQSQSTTVVNNSKQELTIQNSSADVYRPSVYIP